MLSEFELTVCEASWTGVTAFTVIAAHVAEDHDLAVVADHGVAEDLWCFNAIAAIVRSIGKRGSESKEAVSMPAAKSADAAGPLTLEVHLRCQSDLRIQGLLPSLEQRYNKLAVPSYRLVRWCWRMMFR